MSSAFPEVRSRFTSVFAFGGSLVVTGLLFYGIPLAQHFERAKSSPVAVREVTPMTLSRHSSPIRSPVSEPSSPSTSQAPASRKREIASLDLQLSAAPNNAFPVKVSPRRIASEALTMDLPTLRLKPDLIGPIERILTFDDLSAAPRLLNAPPYRFPPSLRRQGVDSAKVVVQIRILPKGKAEFIRIVSSSHRELEDVVRGIIARARFTPPKVNGSPQTVTGLFPLQLEG